VHEPSARRAPRPTIPHVVTSHIDRVTPNLTGRSTILPYPYSRHCVGLVAPSIPFKVCLSDVDHLVVSVVPAYAAICTLALPKGFTLPFLHSSSFYLPVGTVQESGPDHIPGPVVALNILTSSIL
jgi:hypothetical protein